MEESAAEPSNDEGDKLSSVLQAAMYISSPSAIAATTTSSVMQAAIHISHPPLTTSTTAPTSSSGGTPSLSRVGSRERLLDILGQLRADME